jgi:sulfur carrier protein
VAAAQPTPVQAMPAQGSGRDIVVNGAKTATSALTLADLIAELGYGEQRVATARNGEFVAERLRSATSLGDRIEIVAPRQGG